MRTGFDEKELTMSIIDKGFDEEDENERMTIKHVNKKNYTGNR